MTQRTTPSGKLPRPGRADSDAALDQWVRGFLADTFGGVADEQLPDEWMHLLRTQPGEHAAL